MVTGGGRGVGRAIAERLAADGGTVVIIERDEATLDWVPGHPAAGRLSWVTGSAADERVAETAAERAEVAAPLAGWVNNAALFRDAALHTAPPAQVMELIAANLAPVVAGCAVAVRRFLSRGPGRIDRERVEPPGAAGGTGRAALRHGQGCHRGTDRGGRRRGGVPAVRTGQLHHGGGAAGGRRPPGPTQGPGHGSIVPVTKDRIWPNEGRYPSLVSTSSDGHVDAHPAERAVRRIALGRTAQAGRCHRFAPISASLMAASSRRRRISVTVCSAVWADVSSHRPMRAV